MCKQQQVRFYKIKNFTVHLNIHIKVAYIELIYYLRITYSICNVTVQTLVYTNGNLNSGTLEALIQLVVPTLDYFPDSSFLFAFLLSSRLFIKPYELLGRVASLCEDNHRALEKQGLTKVISTEFIVVKICRVLQTIDN